MSVAPSILKASQSPPLDISAIRADFPILGQTPHGKPLVYLDNAATTQKPLAVIDITSHFYSAENSNIHRGVYELSQVATAAYEQARETVARFINASDAREIIFTRGTTEGINLVASGYRQMLRPGDEVLISAMEHHSNIVPWQIACQQSGAMLRVVPMNDAGELLMDDFDRLLSDRTKIVSIVHVSNSLGTVNPIGEIIAKAHRKGAVVLIDGAQWVAHAPTDVQAINADFYAFSGHKLYGPTGVGVLYGKAALLEALPVYQGGGDMISSVTFEKTTYNVLPHKFEAGTPNIAGGIGLAAAIDYVNRIGLGAICEYEASLLAYATEQMLTVPGLRIVGTAAHKGGVVSFVIDDPPLASLDIGTALDAEGIAVRTGHHCCQPVMDRMHISSTARASFAMYNTRQEIDALVNALKKIVAIASGKSPKQSVAEMTALSFPEPSAASPAAAADELAELFEFLGDWDQRHQTLIEMGEKLPAMPEALKTDGTRVRGCMSVVHLYGRKRPGTKDALDFVAESNAGIVNGLIALLERIFAGQSAAEILAFDVEAFLKRVGLDEHLSMGRRNGLGGMILRIRGLANELVSGRGPGT